MNRKHIWLLLTLLLLLCLVSACAGTDTPLEPAPAPQVTTPEPAPEAEPVPTEREIVDMAGRTVTLPATISSAFAPSAVSTMLLYTLNPQLLVGVNYEFNAEEAKYILPAYRDLPAFGQGNGLNLEALVAAAPEVLLIYGTISDSTISDTDSMQEQAGIPCVMLDGALAQTPAAYRLAGQIFGLTEEAEALAQYAEAALAFAADRDIPAAERVRVYYGNGMENLETAPSDSSHAELLELVQAQNVAVMEGEITARLDVSAEQVIGWDPQVILLNGEPKENISPLQAVESFLTDNRYQNVQAVADGKVYAIPKYPYSWFDRPPGPNRLIGIYWLSELLYPELFEIDIKAEARAFYELFYHMELDDVQLQELLGF